MYFESKASIFCADQYLVIEDIISIRHMYSCARALLYTVTVELVVELCMQARCLLTDC